VLKVCEEESGGVFTLCWQLRRKMFWRFNPVLTGQEEEPSGG
jgi:hypothetical protein